VGPREREREAGRLERQVVEWQSYEREKGRVVKLTQGEVQLANIPPCTRWYDEATGCRASARLGGKG
jgi:hypothetical protein